MSEVRHPLKPDQVSPVYQDGEVVQVPNHDGFKTFQEPAKIEVQPSTPAIQLRPPEDRVFAHQVGVLFDYYNGWDILDGNAPPLNGEIAYGTGIHGFAFREEPCFSVGATCRATPVDLALEQPNDLIEFRFHSDGTSIWHDLVQLVSTPTAAGALSVIRGTVHEGIAYADINGITVVSVDVDLEGTFRAGFSLGLNGEIEKFNYREWRRIQGITFDSPARELGEPRRYGRHDHDPA